MPAAEALEREDRAPVPLRVSRPGAPERGEVLLRTLPGEPPLDYYSYLPESAGPRAPLLVLVHGISEVPRQLVERFSHLAERHGAVLAAPHFARPAFRDYQRLGRVGRGARADDALDRLLDDTARRGCARTGRVYLFGYSGGGQFVHRYAMAHPTRVAAAVVCSAGWYTFPDPRRRYPFGTRSCDDLPGVHLESDAYLRVPFLVTVGARDVERDASLRQTPGVDRRQGRHRVERAERWVEAMARAARKRGLPAPARLEVLAGVGHSLAENADRGALADLAIEFLFARRREGR
jgi:pimeloyl-ACP methyl ester carboxylesterase